MMPRILAVATAALFAVAAQDGTAPRASKEVQAELKRLDGEWRIASAEQDGEPIESKTVARFAAGKLTLTDPGFPALELALALDPSKAPPWLDVTNRRGATHRGIYELKGDTLRVVSQPDANAPRPTEFRTKAGSGLVMYTYERVKAK